MNKFSKGLHQSIELKARNGVVKLSELKPNSQEIARRLISQGVLIKSKCGKGYVMHELAR